MVFHFKVNRAPFPLHRAENVETCGDVSFSATLASLVAFRSVAPGGLEKSRFDLFSVCFCPLRHKMIWGINNLTGMVGFGEFVSWSTTIAAAAAARTPCPVDFDTLGRQIRKFPRIRVEFSIS